MIIDDVMAMNIIIIYTSCTLQRSVWRNMAGSRSQKQQTRPVRRVLKRGVTL